MASIEITTRIGCKIACPYCPQDRFIAAYTRNSSAYTLSFDHFRTCIDKIPRKVAVHFSGMCEPWLNRDCTAMVAHACRKGHPVRIFTTLVGMSHDDAATLSQLTFRKFIVHLPSIDRSENITVDDQYLELVRQIHEYGFVTSWITYSDQVDPGIRKILGTKIERMHLNSRAGNLGQEEGRRLTGVIACRRDLRQNVMLPNGDVLVCCMDYGLQHVLGNLLRSDYHSLFDSAEFHTIRAGLSDETRDILCRRCEFAYLPETEEKPLFRKPFFTRLRRFFTTNLFTRAT